MAAVRAGVRDDLRDARVLEQARAAALDHRGQAAGVLQRVEMERVGLEQAARVALRARVGAELVVRQQLPVHVELARHEFLAPAQRRVVLEPVGQHDAAFDRVAGDAVLLDAAADRGDGVARQPVHRARAGGAQVGQQLLVVEAEAAEDEAAVAAGGAVADRLAFQDHHVALAALDQADGRGEPAKPPPITQTFAWTAPRSAPRAGEGPAVAA